MAPPNEATGSPRSSGSTWLDYVAALLGSVAGGYLIGGLLVRWGDQAQPGSLLFAIFGPILLVPLASALGATVALALTRRHSPVLTGILMMPITVVVWLVVFSLTRVIDIMDYGWLLIMPPLVAPLGARWIVLGRKEPPEPALPPFQDWPIRRIVQYGVLALLGGLLIWFLATWLISDSDPVELEPQEPRPCECEQLKEWFESMAISAEGDSFRASNIRAAESDGGFILVGSQYQGDQTDPDHFWRSFRQAGFNGVQLLDEIDHWSATFFEGDTRRESPWIVDVTLLENRIETTIRIQVDGAEWGIESADHLWQLYISDREAALQGQRERQMRALDILRPVEQALRSIDNG